MSETQARLSAASREPAVLFPEPIQESVDQFPVASVCQEVEAVMADEVWKDGVVMSVG